MSALGIDFGTSNTVAAVCDGDRVRHLLFDGSPLLPSAVSAGPAGLLVGADAIRSMIGAPGAFEANPKRRIDDGAVWLGDRAVPVVELIAAVLRTVLAEAVRVEGRPPARTVLTHPAAWGRGRLDVLAAAASSAGLTGVVLLPEPVAAHRHLPQRGHGARPGVHHRRRVHGHRHLHRPQPRRRSAVADLQAGPGPVHRLRHPDPGPVKGLVRRPSDTTSAPPPHAS